MPACFMKDKDIYNLHCQRKTPLQNNAFWPFKNLICYFQKLCRFCWDKLRLKFSHENSLLIVFDTETLCEKTLSETRTYINLLQIRNASVFFLKVKLSIVLNMYGLTCNLGHAVSYNYYRVICLLRILLVAKT